MTLHAYRFTIRREYHGVIAAESLLDAEAALEAGNVDEIDCVGGEAEYSVMEASREEVDSAELNDCLFDDHGDPIAADGVVCDEELDEPLIDEQPFTTSETTDAPEMSS